MSLMTDEEINGLMQILNYLPNDVLLSLAQTVAGNKNYLGNEKDCIQKILSNSTNAQQLLKRLKIKKEYLFRYLCQNKISDINLSASKEEMVKKILEFWHSGEIFEVGATNAEPMNDVDADNKLQQHDLIDQKINNLNSWADKTLQINAMDREFSVKFCTSFYTNLNSAINWPSHDILQNNACSSSQFFNDCPMIFIIKRPNELSVNLFVGASEVSSILLKLVVGERALFIPNLTEKGIESLCDSFGRKVVIVAGVIHQGTNCAIFEQHFGLVKEIASDSWKIRFTRIAFLIKESLHNLPEPILDNTKSASY